MIDAGCDIPDFLPRMIAVLDSAAAGALSRADGRKVILLSRMRQMAWEIAFSPTRGREKAAAPSAILPLPLWEILQNQDLSQRLSFRFCW
jgi:hypothetical protein